MRTLALVLIASIGACTPNWKQTPHDTTFQHVAAPKLHVAPAAASVNSDWWDIGRHSVVLPLAHAVSPARYVGKLVGGRAALDINAFALVPDSSWFKNRIGRSSQTAQGIAKGAVTHPGPAPGILTIIEGKTEGVTAGVIVRDSQSVVWFMKFDPPASLELTTGAEIIASRFLHAAGYYVPEMHIEAVAQDRLVLDTNAKTQNRYHEPVRLTKARLRVLLSQLNPTPEGTLRALFSRSIPGKSLGPFQYQGVRIDDPNDTIPHEQRRSLRGLWVFSAWLGNHDTRDVNTLDAFITTQGSLGYIRHYLLDFGDALGATGTRAKHLSEGYEHRADWVEIGKRVVTLGMTYPYWLAVRRSPILSVGVFESDVFDPARWAPMVPNAAFEEATARDTFWAASILARFTKEHIDAAVATAQYSDPKAATTIATVLRERQRKLLKFAFANMLGVSEPVVEGNYEVQLTDLEVLAGLHTEPSQYEWTIQWNRTRAGDVRLLKQRSATPVISLRESIRKALAKDHAGLERDPFFTLTLRRLGKSPAVRIHVRLVRDHVIVVGMERDVD